MVYFLASLKVFLIIQGTAVAMCTAYFNFKITSLLLGTTCARVLYDSQKKLIISLNGMNW